jgi:23S rRNA (guanine1835-N2)-methyltransferase
MKTADTSYPTPYGTFELRRYPARPEEPLQAWCAADSLLLEEVHKRTTEGSDILVINDSQGALSVPLQPSALWTDSAVSALALEQNLQANNQTATPIYWSTQTPPQAALVVMRIPKQYQYLEYQLAQLAALLPAGATVLAAGMDKHLSPRTADLLEHYIGATQRHRGRHKARIFSSIRDDRTAQSPAMTTTYSCEPLGNSLQSLPNVFSRDKLDNGSRFLLEHLPTLDPAEIVIDLACGNGVIGLAACAMGLTEKLVFLDESAMAVASARLNADKVFPDKAANFSFEQGDGLKAYSGEPAQLILCNPPFHMDHTVDEFAGYNLLKRCADHLTNDGRLCFVANRHLDYRPILKRSFKRIEKLAGNARFNILVAYKS